MNCPKCHSDLINYSMNRDSNGIMHAYCECQKCHMIWEKNMITIPSPTEEKPEQPEVEIPMKGEDGKSIRTFPIILLIALAAWLIGTILLLFFSSFLGVLSLLALVICIAVIFSMSTKEQAPNLHTEYRDDMTGLEYEKLVAKKLSTEGYSNVRVTPGSGDHGADILAVAPNGESIAIQCKKYSSSVGQRAVQEAVAAKDYYKCHRAMVITNSTFTPAAHDFAQNTNTILREHYT